MLFPAASGASGMQKTFRRPLLILGALVGTRAARRVRQRRQPAHGAGHDSSARDGAADLDRRRAVAADPPGARRKRARWRSARQPSARSIAWWSPPCVVSMLATIDNPVRMHFDVEWRALAFLAVLTARRHRPLRARSRRSAHRRSRRSGALKGAEDPHSHRRLTKALVARPDGVLRVRALRRRAVRRDAQPSVELSARLLASPRVVVLAADARGKTTPPQAWTQVADRLRATPGVESVAICRVALDVGERLDDDRAAARRRRASLVPRRCSTCHRDSSKR